MEQKIPRPEYPRPQFVRKDWMNLNGEWEFEQDPGVSGKERQIYERELKERILVPFCPESDLSGIRVGEIAAKTHLTRPSVSHHLQILKEAGIVAMRREGTRNYYYLGADETRWKEMADLTNTIYESIRYIGADS